MNALRLALSIQGILQAQEEEGLLAAARILPMAETLMEADLSQGLSHAVDLLRSALSVSKDAVSPEFALERTAKEIQDLLEDPCLSPWEIPSLSTKNIILHLSHMHDRICREEKREIPWEISPLRLELLRYIRRATAPQENEFHYCPVPLHDLLQNSLSHSSSGARKPRNAAWTCLRLTEAIQACSKFLREPEPAQETS